MKYTVLGIIILCLTLTSCSAEEESTNFFLEVIAIESVTVPETFTLGETHQISVSYNRPSNCYEFNTFLNQLNGNESTVAVLNTVYTDIQCEAINEPVVDSFNFEVTNVNPYIFKFYQGDDALGNALYYIIKIPVVD